MDENQKGQSKTETDFRSIKPMSEIPNRELRTDEATVIFGHGLFVVGRRLFGVVDDVPRHFYVATFFWHFWFIPLIPRESWLVFHYSEGGAGLQGVPIGLSWKSVFVAWIRTGCWLVGLASLVGGLGTLIAVLDGQPAGATWLIAVLAFFGLWLTKLFRKASPERALALAIHADLPPAVVDSLRERMERFTVPDETQT
jgi:hypothetical protein